MKVLALPHALALLLVACACLACASPEERARTACQGEVKRHLFHPEAAIFDNVKVERADGGWRVALRVKAPTVGGEPSSSSVVCTLGPKMELTDLSGDANPAP